MSDKLLKLITLLPITMAWGGGVFFVLANRDYNMSNMINLGYGICFLVFMLAAVGIQYLLISIYKGVK